MFPYSTVVLADNENLRLTVCVTTTSPLIEAQMQFGVRAAPVSRPAPVRPYDGGGTTKLIATHPSDDEVES
jgi:hypothetical protein